MNTLNGHDENYITGWVSLYRSFIQWEWFNVPNIVTIFIYCLLRANFQDNNWRGIEIKKGSFVTSIEKISKDTNISIQSVRTCLRRLEKTGEINKQSNKQNTIITICKYELYQDNKYISNKQANKQLTNDQQTANKQLTTDNKDNNYNKENNEEDVLFTIDKLKERYLSDEDLVSAVSQTLNTNHGEIEKKLTTFNEHLKSTGINSKKWLDYTSHFLNWSKKQEKNIYDIPDPFRS